MKKILGLDLGTNSIGWALTKEEQGIARIADGGVRIFIRSVEDKNEIPKNVARRKSRLSRRVIERRKRRRSRVLNFLISKKLLPSSLANNPAPETILNEIGNPYELRKKALDESVLPFELGRIILHMASRRGFLSNRKIACGNLIDDPDFLELEAEKKLELDSKETAKDKPASKEEKEREKEEREKEEKKMKAEIEELKNSIKTSGARTLGEYLANLSTQERKRNRYTERKMYMDELELIWEKQATYHSIAKDSNFKKQIETLLFKQRPLKLKADRLGRCSLEEQRSRARKSWPNVQRFRYWQDLNNLQCIDSETGEITNLSFEDKKTLAETLEKQKTLTWGAIRKKLGLKKVKFNLEESKKHITGCLSAYDIRKIIKDEWDAFSPLKQTQLAEDLITISDKKGLKKRLVKYWGFTAKQAVLLATIDLEPGLSNYSVKAINKLLPFLKEGLELSKARVKANYGYEKKKTIAKESLGAPPLIPNPIVSRALSETRKLINAVILEHGKPDEIRIEMARDLKMSKKQKEKYEKQQKQNEKANFDAKKKYNDVRDNNPALGLSQYPSRSDLIKYRLWKEAEMICVYSGRSISCTELFSSEIEIDHILPFSRTLDDSFTNKVVCFVSENRHKANRTPYEAWNGTDKYERIKQAIRNIKNKKKLRAFYIEELDDGFLNSQISDTAYISREVLHYVKGLYDSDKVDKAVTVSKGKFTAWLRHMWGLNSIISSEDKKDRSDYRHHLIDAIVMTQISRSLYARISEEAKIREEKESYSDNKNKLNIEKPWQEFRYDVKNLLAETIISHAPRRRLTGALHEDTAYGIKESPQTGKKISVYRKTLDKAFTKKQIEKVVDPVLKEKLLERVKKCGEKAVNSQIYNIEENSKLEKEILKYVKKSGEKATFEQIRNIENHPILAEKAAEYVRKEGEKTAFSDENPFVYLKNQGRVRHVRIIQSNEFNDDSYLAIKDFKGKPYKYHPFGNNHHVEILKHKKPDKKGNIKYKPEFVTVWQAAQRVRAKKQSYVKKDHGADLELVMVLCKNDMVSVEIGGKIEICRVQKLDRTNNRLKLRKHNDATVDNKSEKLLFAISTLMTKYNLQKLKINILGKIANDKKDNRNK